MGACRKRSLGNYSRWLYDQGLISEMLDVDRAFTNDFIR